MRSNQRAHNTLRPIKIAKNYTKYAEGAVLFECGDTKVICTASIVSGVPPFLKNTGKGWLTAEYSMLPRSTHERIARESTKGKQTGRTQEIQRLIGRALRTCVDLTMIGENTIMVDCDVIQADGGTRTASITGGCVAIYQALEHFRQQKNLTTHPFLQFVAAISVGIIQGQAMLDLEYVEDVQAETDMNVVMTEKGDFIELQGTAEKNVFNQDQLNSMLELAKSGIAELIEIQKEVLKK